VDACLGQCLEVQDYDDLARWSSRYLFLGPITRAYEPGYKLDVTPVLIGGQGCGKSTYARLLLPPAEPAWFTDALSFGLDDKQRIEAMLGAVIVEISEMAGTGRRENEEIKSFLSRQTDRMRLSYAKHPSDMPRLSVFVGTSNDTECLPNDPTGNRRFVVVRVGRHAIGYESMQAYLNENRDQLWAEALCMYRQGMRPVNCPGHCLGCRQNAIVNTGAFDTGYDPGEYLG